MFPLMFTPTVRSLTRTEILIELTRSGSPSLTHPNTSGDLAFEFRDPPFAPVRRRGAVLATFVPVPEAAMDENDRFVFCQYNVRAAGQSADVKPKPIPHAVERTTNANFWRRVLAADLQHVP